MAQDKGVHNLWIFVMIYEVVKQTQICLVFLVSLTHLPVGHLLSFSTHP